MGIRGGSGKGQKPGSGPPRKPLLPTPRNPFPEKGEFRLGGYVIEEEKDDYLICRGFDPNAKNPFSEYTPSTPKQTIFVAKPPLLLRTDWDGETKLLPVNGVLTLVTFNYTGIGVRTSTVDGIPVVQRITPAYFPGDTLIAVEVRRNAAIDGVDVYSETGGRLSWVDLNTSGRSWANETDSSTIYLAALPSGTFSIPAMTGNDTPGSVLCDLYEISGGVIGPVLDDGVPVQSLVYNPSPWPYYPQTVAGGGDSGYFKVYPTSTGLYVGDESVSDVFIATLKTAEFIPAQVDGIPGQEDCLFYKIKDIGAGPEIVPITNEHTTDQHEAPVFNMYSRDFYPQIDESLASTSPSDLQGFFKVHRLKTGFYVCDQPDQQGSDCVSTISGVNVLDIPEISDMGDLDSLLGVDINGCVVRVPTSPCSEASSSPSTSPSSSPSAT